MYESGMDPTTSLITKAVQNAFIYGYRVRFLHSAAYNLATLRTTSELKDIVKKLLKSVKMGVDHGKVLACFAVAYRITHILLKRLKITKGIEFTSGFTGGVLIYSGILNKLVPGFLNDNILMQITMYTLSRLVIAVGRDLSLLFNERSGDVRDFGWIVSCGIIWGGIMQYYRKDTTDGGQYLPRALRLSLEFIYGGVKHGWNEAFQYGK